MEIRAFLSQEYLRRMLGNYNVFLSISSMCTCYGFIPVIHHVYVSTPLNYCLVNVLHMKYMFGSECNSINTDAHTLSGRPPGRSLSATMHGLIVLCLQPKGFHLQNATSSHDKLCNIQNVS